MGRKKKEVIVKFHPISLWLASAPETQGNLCFSQCISDLDVRLSNRLRRGWPGGLSTEIRGREPGFLNPDSPPFSQALGRDS